MKLGLRLTNGSYTVTGISGKEYIVGGDELKRVGLI